MNYDNQSSIQRKSDIVCDAFKESIFLLTWPVDPIMQHGGASFFFFFFFLLYIFFSQLNQWFFFCIFITTLGYLKPIQYVFFSSIWFCCWSWLFSKICFGMKIHPNLAIKRWGGRKEYQLPASEMLCNFGCHALDFAADEFTCGDVLDLLLLISCFPWTT